MVNLKRICIASAIFLFFGQVPSVAMEKLGQSSTSMTHALAPNGLVVVIADKPETPSLNLRAVSNPFISGVALQIHWSDIEPTEGKPDWSKLDALFSTGQKSKKFVHLLVFPGFFTPAWALRGVRTEEFPIQYGPGKGTVKVLPVPWDTVYLNRWFDFLKLLSRRYGTSPAFRVVAADGPTSVSAESTLPNSRGDLTKWQSLGYTPTKYVGAWQKVFHTYATDFPNQYVSLSAAAGQVGIDDQGKIQRGQKSSTRQAIIDAAMSTLGGRFVLQSSNVHAGAGPHSSGSEADDQMVLSYCGRAVTGLQMRTSAEQASAVMGAAGNPSLALRKSIDLAMQTNAAGQHINYVEIYEPDVLAADMQLDLRYGASLFAPQRAK